MVIWMIVAALLVYFGLSVGYLFILSVAGRFWYKTPAGQNAPGQTQTQAQTQAQTPETETQAQTPRSIAILVPAYREDGVIISTAQHLLDLAWPGTRCDIHIIADSLQPGTVAKLRSLPVNVLEVSFPKSTKTRSLNAFFLSNKKQYDLALICDADNMLGQDFLQKVNTAFDQGARAVQGRRVAKNIDTPIAMLDACSEGINNHLFRQGPAALGLSSALIGSGMVFEYDTLREIMPTIEAVGEDKILQLRIVEKGIRIEYLRDAIVFDEKIDSPKALQQQRRRWVYSQVANLKEFFVPGFRQLFKGNISYFNLAVGNNLVLPRSFLLALLPLAVIGGFLAAPVLGYWALAIWGLYLVTLLVALPPELFRKELGQALLHLPKAVVVMLTTVFKLRSAGKTFIHTAHTKTTISNNLYKQ